MSKFLLTYFSFIILFFCGCANIYQESHSYLITFKAQQISYSDIGFVNKSQNLINVQLFNASAPVLDIKLSSNACLNGYCTKYKNFNQKFLSSHYPDKLIKNIFDSKPIFDGENLTLNSTGFTQKIKKQNLNIKYTVNKNDIYFKDNKNKILIKVISL